MACCEVLFGTVPPTAPPSEAQIPLYIDRTSKKVYYWNGTGWELTWELKTAGVGTPGVVSIDPNSPIHIGEGGTLQISLERLKTQCGFATAKEVSEAVTSAINELTKSLNTSVQNLDSRVTNLSTQVTQLGNDVTKLGNDVTNLGGRVTTIEAWDLCAKTKSCGYSAGGGGGAAGLVHDSTNGIAAVTMTSADRTLTALQYGKPIIVLSGALTADLNLIFPAIAGEWTVVNNCTGSYTVTCKTAAGTGVALTSGGKIRIVWGDGTNVYSAVNASDTPAQFDNSLLLATTAFVQRAIGGFGQLVGYGTAGQTIPASQANSHINLFGTCSSITLPLANSVPAGSVLMFDGVSLACTINRQGTNVIFLNGSNNTATSLVVNDGGSVMFVSDGSASWFATGIATLKYADEFSASLAGNGYQKLPSGLIIQWGQTGNIVAGGSQAISFPVAFTTSVYSMAFANAYATGVASITASIGATFSGALVGFTAYNQGTANNNAAGWIAIGK